MEMFSDILSVENLPPLGDELAASTTTTAAGSTENFPESVLDLVARFWPIPLHGTFVDNLLAKFAAEDLYTLQDLARFARGVKEKESLAVELLKVLQHGMSMFNKMKFADLLKAASSHAGDSPKDHFIVLKSPAAASMTTMAAVPIAQIITRDFLAQRIRDWCNDCATDSKPAAQTMHAAFLETDGHHLKASVVLTYPDASHVSVRCELCTRTYNLAFDRNTKTLSLATLTRHIRKDHASPSSAAATSDDTSSTTPKKRKLQTKIRAAPANQATQATVTSLPPPLDIGPPSMENATSASSVAPNAPDLSRF